MGEDFQDGIREGNLTVTELQWALREGKYGGYPRRMLKQAIQQSRSF